MATVVKDDSSSALVLVIVLLALAIGGFVAYQQGLFSDNDTEINVNLPNGESISGEISR